MSDKSKIGAALGAAVFGISTRAYKAMFRRRAKKLWRAVEDYRGGCAYTPTDAYSALRRIEQDVRLVLEAVSEKKWGR